MPFFWFSRSRRAKRNAAIERLTLAAYERGLEAGKAQGWQEAETVVAEPLRQKLIEQQRELAVAETRRKLDVRQAYGQGLTFGQAFATYEDHAWIERAVRRAS